MAERSPGLIFAAALVVLAAVARIGLEGEGWLEGAWGGKGDDFAVVLVAVSPFVLGLVARAWWAVLFVAAVFALSVGVEQLLWSDDPRLSGIDDLPPVWGLLMTPFPMLVAALGVVAGRAARSYYSSSGGRAVGPSG